ncbi:hypothetical protein RM780_01675 [Streptomyces sp. DSM 44917]|uniref:TPR repeat domain-containing protein n=1 Tax=Streptomyces boetiae TaxID=3075541 RepID=A0ABU2L297_9ACTN|nr:hypothetical protein [Streptomyces sp. DSM 44917]MDT0305673.1 hypothetical protein [Streptomyces sp. DSM 44917]
MPNLRFTREDVEARGKKPWTRQRQFSQEIDPGDMADTAAIYARAAGEAENAGELARHATQLGADSGGFDGDSLVDDEGRIQETARGLQGNGRNMDEVVRYLVRAMNHAVDAEEQVRDLVFGDGMLEEMLTRKNHSSVHEWEGWQQALTEAVSRRNANAATNPNARSVPLTVVHNGRSLSLAPSSHAADGSAVYSLPDSLAEDIRERHINETAEYASDYDTQIAEAINAYRRRLAEYGLELDELGYDLSDGPFRLFLTEEQARFAAGRLAAELEKDRPDTDVLLMYTQTLESLVQGIYEQGSGVPHGGGDPARDLTAAERAYLQQFFGRLDADDLVRLGHLTEQSRDLDPGVNGLRFAAAQNVSNGLMMLMNPEIGGIDPSTEAGRAQVPSGVRPFVYDYERSGLYPPETGGGYHSVFGTEGFREEMERFNAFGGLLDSANIASGDQFSRDLAHAALDVQQRTNNQYVGAIGGSYGDPTENHFGTGLLSAAALNTEASAGLMNDGEFRERFLNSSWEDSQGAGELVRSATTIPEGMDHNATEARQYVQAAYNLLSSAPDAEPAILGERVPPMMRLEDHLDHSRLQQAIGDTALQYMDMISKNGQESGFHAPGDPNDPNARTDRDLLGNDYRYSFQLSGSDREALFGLMNSTDQPVRTDFFNGVTTWQGTTAYNAFVRDGEGPPQQSAAFDAIGRIAGTVEHVQREDAGSGDPSSRGQATTLATIAASAAAIKDLTPPTPAKLAVIAGAYGIGELVRGSMPDPAAIADQRNQEVVNHGDTGVRAIVAEAAVRADYHGAGDTTLPDTRSADVDEEDLRRATLGLEGARYSAYRDALIEAYNDATHN